MTLCTLFHKQFIFKKFNVHKYYITLKTLTSISEGTVSNVMNVRTERLHHTNHGILSYKTRHKKKSARGDKSTIV